MKVLLFLKKHWFKVLSFVLIFAISSYSLMFGIKRARNFDVLKGEEKQQHIITIWHIETFEGGGKTRADYLKNIIHSIEKQDEQTLFLLRSIKPENLQNELCVSSPDIISFGFGVGKQVLPFLKEFNNAFNVRDELIESGSFNRKLYGIPYMIGGYAIFNHTTTKNEFHCGSNGFTKPEFIYNSLNLVPQKIESQYEAYKTFANNKNVQLLGTTRDLFRINNLNKIGRTNAMISPVSTYTDLIQYIGITNQNDVTMKFVQRCMSVEMQTKLVDYALFSVLHNKLYYDGIYNDMENAIFSCTIPKVFE
jgi:hypothetical protein